MALFRFISSMKWYFSPYLYLFIFTPLFLIVDKLSFLLLKICMFSMINF